MPQWETCYACGASPWPPPRARPDSAHAASRWRASRSGSSAPFAEAKPAAVAVETTHATQGEVCALPAQATMSSWDGPQDWSGYDFLKADASIPRRCPVSALRRDPATTRRMDYWTRVNYQTVLPPGASTLICPTDLYVGEKSRPGRPLDKAHITRFVLSADGAQAAALLRQPAAGARTSPTASRCPACRRSRSVRARRRRCAASPPSRRPPSTPPGRGYGLKNAQIWRAYDALQPDPLYQVGICIEKRRLCGRSAERKYHVFVNIDSPSGFWGEYQVYRKRTVQANGVPVVQETMDLPEFLKRYFRFADVEDRPEENTFDKYQAPYFQEKEFDVEVRDGQLVPGVRGRDLGELRLRAGDLSRRPGGAGKQYLANLRGAAAILLRQLLQARAAGRPPRPQGRNPCLRPTRRKRRRATPCSRATGWRTCRSTPCRAARRRPPLEAFASAGREGADRLLPLSAARPAGRCGVRHRPDLAGRALFRHRRSGSGVVSHRLTRVTGGGHGLHHRAALHHAARLGAAIRKGRHDHLLADLTHSGAREGRRLPGARCCCALPTAGRIACRCAFASSPRRSTRWMFPPGPGAAASRCPGTSPTSATTTGEMFRKSLAKMREYGCTTFSGIPHLAHHRLEGRQAGDRLHAGRPGDGGRPRGRVSTRSS